MIEKQQIKKINDVKIYESGNKLHLEITGIAITEEPFKLGFKTKESDLLSVKLTDIYSAINEFLKMVK